MSYIYPRLSRGLAQTRLAEIREISIDRPEHLIHLVQYSHPSSKPVATGGSLASTDHLATVRQKVMERIKDWEGKIVGSRSAEFDRKLGKALHLALNIVPADAAHEDTWTFLTLMVFPDLAYQRFPNLPDERLIGMPRNVLRRVWLRYEVLRELGEQGTPPLGEDELVGLFERTALARNRHLVRALVEYVISYSGTDARSEFSRQLFKQVRVSTGAYLLDIMEHKELLDHVAQIANKINREY